MTSLRVVVNMFIACRKRKSSSGKEEKKARVKGSIKYSAAKLHERGVVLEIENLSTDQLVLPFQLH